MLSSRTKGPACGSVSKVVIKGSLRLTCTVVRSPSYTEPALDVQVRTLKAGTNAAADEAASLKFRLQTARQAASELRELIVDVSSTAPFEADRTCQCMRHWQSPRKGGYQVSCSCPLYNWLSAAVRVCCISGNLYLEGASRGHGRLNDHQQQ